MRPKGSRELCGRITVDEVKMLRQALSAAQLDRCDFPEEVKDRIRIYMDTWVAAPIERALTGLTRRHNKATDDGSGSKMGAR